MLKLFKKLAALVGGDTENAEKEDVEVVTTNVGGILFEHETVRMVPPKLDELYRDAQRRGFEGECDYRKIQAYLKDRHAYCLWDAGKWIVQKAPTVI